jgi:nucleoid DNA-binding protein
LSFYISNSRIAGIPLNDTADVLENCVEKMEERIDSLNLKKFGAFQVKITSSQRFAGRLMTWRKVVGNFWIGMVIR